MCASIHIKNLKHDATLSKAIKPRLCNSPDLQVGGNKGKNIWLPAHRQAGSQNYIRAKALFGLFSFVPQPEGRGYFF